tara:strand:- start:208 stop:432 length:225 start_codon:yes stop_codon:yes gene_type:complete
MKQFNMITLIYMIWKSYYPVILAFFSFLYSVSLWFSGDELEGIFVGIWVPSILALSIVIKQSNKDYDNQTNRHN